MEMRENKRFLERLREYFGANIKFSLKFEDNIIDEFKDINFFHFCFVKLLPIKVF
jgi:hypothetical protein